MRKGVPADLDVICRKALEKDPGKRYRSVAAFGDDLVRWQDGRPIKARAVGPFAGQLDLETT